MKQFLVYCDGFFDRAFNTLEEATKYRDAQTRLAYDMNWRDKPAYYIAEEETDGTVHDNAD